MGLGWERRAVKPPGFVTAKFARAGAGQTLSVVATLSKRDPDYIWGQVDRGRPRTRRILHQTSESGSVASMRRSFRARVGWVRLG